LSENCSYICAFVVVAITIYNFLQMWKKRTCAHSLGAADCWIGFLFLHWNFLGSLISDFFSNSPQNF
jgi:hypothetical protein